jgi:hypothetical protein
MVSVKSCKCDRDQKKEEEVRIGYISLLEGGLSFGKPGGVLPPLRGIGGSIFSSTPKNMQKG